MKDIDYISGLTDLDLNRLIAFDLVGMEKDINGSHHQDNAPDLLESLKSKAMVLTLNNNTELYDYCNSWDDVMPLAKDLGVGIAMNIYGEWGAHSRDHKIKNGYSDRLCRHIANVCASALINR